MKIAVIGAGSTYTPELVSGLSQLDVGELVLHDIDAERLEVVGGLARRMLERAGYGGALLAARATSTRALDGADFVLVQIRVGGQAARLADETVPLALRLHRPGDDGRRRLREGDAHGAGRARDRRARRASAPRPAPGSSTSRTRSGSSRARCSTPATARSGSATSRSASSGCSRALLGVEPERVVVDQVGLNHLTWVRAVRLDGRDVLPELLAEHGDELADEIELPRSVLDELGAIPSYYLHYFYAHDGVLAEQLGRRAARADASPRSSASCSSCTAIRR